MRNCEYCGSQILDGATICSGCGAKVKQNIEKTQPALRNTKYCIHCGNQILNEAVLCPKCGCSVGKSKKNNNISDSDKSRVLKLAVKIFMLVAVGSCVVNGIGVLLSSGWFAFGVGRFEFSHRILTSVVPIAWILPMTIHYFKATKNNQPISMGFKVCTLIFVSFIAGILMLCDNNNNFKK